MQHPPMPQGFRHQDPSLRQLVGVWEVHLWAAQGGTSRPCWPWFPAPREECQLSLEVLGNLRANCALWGNCYDPMAGGKG